MSVTRSWRRTRLTLVVGLFAALHAGVGAAQDRTLSQRLPEIAAEEIIEPAAGGVPLEAFEGSALATSPSLRQLESLVRAARWQCLQAGLPPNPTAGYVANEMGVDGAAGQQGAFVGQQFVRGGKLGYAQAVASKEARRLEQQFAVERLRVLTDTRTAFYDAFLTQQERRLAEQLVGVSEKAVTVSEALREAGEGPRTDVLQAQIENQRAVATMRGVERRVLAAWRKLAVLTGRDTSTPQPLDADRAALITNLAWEPTVAELLSVSPQIAERVAAVEKAKCEVAYQRSLAVQDVTAQVAVQYDDAASDTIASLQIGMPLPLWNRNQGGIGRARAELTASRRRLEATEQVLRRRLAEAIGRYQATLAQVETLQSEVQPRATQNLSLATEGYVAGELGFLDLLTVQRTYFNVSLELLDGYRELNVSAQLIQGCLLAGSGTPGVAE
ncbi:MAG: TolC family protein [Planctomycetota bacterium]